MKTVSHYYYYYYYYYMLIIARNLLEEHEKCGLKINSEKRFVHGLYSVNQIKIRNVALEDVKNLNIWDIKIDKVDRK